MWLPRVDSESLVRFICRGRLVDLKSLRLGLESKHSTLDIRSQDANPSANREPESETQDRDTQT
jgi:hypothetical protein